MAVDVKISQFCSLSSSPSWQAWLYNFSQDLYRLFMTKMQSSRGCNHNREIMQEILNVIDGTPAGADKLVEFLSKHYPHSLIVVKRQATPGSNNEVFVLRNSRVVTYPRRVIIEGNDLGRRVKSFVIDKLKHDSVIIGSKAYIEYLTQDDAQIVSQVPLKNWLIAAWRSRQMKT